MTCSERIDSCTGCDRRGGGTASSITSAITERCGNDAIRGASSDDIGPSCESCERRAPPQRRIAGVSSVVDDMDTSLDQTLVRLDAVLDEATADNSMLAVFPAMYRSVTFAVREAVRVGGFFEDDVRLEELTVVFAGRYLEAYDLHRSGEEPTAAWQLAFSIAESRHRRMILQHLLLGMNAHINLDLGLATWRVGGSRLPAVYADFIRVNEILFHILDQLQGGLDTVSPRISWLDRLGGQWDERLMRLGIRTARDLAWNFAVRLSETSSQSGEIAERDDDTTWLGKLIARRWSPVHLIGSLIAGAESRSVADIVTAMSVTDIDLDTVARNAYSATQSSPAEGTSLRAAVATRRPRSANRRS